MSKTATRPAKVEATSFRIVLKPSHLIPTTGITIVGVTSADEARAELHKEIDRLIIQIEKGR